MKTVSFRNDVLPLKDKLFRLALRITLNREDAEDIVQDTLVKVWRELQRDTTIDNLEAFSLTVCRRLCLDLKNKKETQNIPFDQQIHDRPDVSPLPSERLEKDERLTQLHQLIDSLPEKQRTAVQLRDIEERSYKEIADIMQISESDVKVNIFRARKKIKESLSNAK